MLFKVIVFIVAILSIVLNIIYRLQIRDLYSQIDFVNTHETNKAITKQFGLKSTGVLIDKLNEMLSIHRETTQEYRVKDEALKEAITNISHDIRTPLTSLDGYFQLLLEADSRDEQERYMGIIETRIDKLKGFLEDMFIYMNIQDGNYELQLKSCNINKIVYDNLLSYYEDFRSKDIEPKLNIPEKPIIIDGNVSALNRIVDNLVKNSLIYGKEYVGVTLMEENNGIKLIFENDIEDEKDIDVDNIFNRFYKQDKARTVNSTGLGLTIVKELVDSMGGEITASVSKGVFSIGISFSMRNF